MIRFFLGEDTQESRKKGRALFERLREEHPSHNAAYFDDVFFDPTLATESFSGENLFGGQNILYFDGILDHPDGESFYRNVLRATDHEVIVRERAPNKDMITFFERLGETSHFPLTKVAEKRMTSFAIADALGSRDKRSSWVEFEKVRRAGIAMEEVHGTIAWGFKSMLCTLLMDKQSATRTGMKEYTYRTYSAYAKNYGLDELKDKLTELKEIYHKGHRGEGELEELLEHFILNN
jgi:hypothetical protein